MKYEETYVLFPDFWKADKGKFAPLKIRARCILELQSYLLVDAEIMFDDRDELQFKFKPKYDSSNKKSEHHTKSEEDRSFSDIMSSKWAQEIEKEVLSRTEEKEGRATLLPIIFNSDGVALREYCSSNLWIIFGLLNSTSRTRTKSYFLSSRITMAMKMRTRMSLTVMLY
jgi:hypothetical protein